MVIKNPSMSFEKSRRVTSASWPNLPIGLWPSWPPNNPHICWLAASLCLLSTSKLVCGGRSSAIFLLSHHPGGWCTLVVDEEIPPDNVERFECLEKHKSAIIIINNKKIQIEQVNKGYQYTNGQLYVQVYYNLRFWMYMYIMCKLKCRLSMCVR